MDEKQRFDDGMQVRRAVLGNAHVDRAEANRTELTTEFQDLRAMLGEKSGHAPGWHDILAAL